MKRNYIARRFQLGGTGLSLDTEALSKYKDIIDLSIGDTDFTTDEAIISAAFRDAGLGHTHYGDPKGDPELISAVCRAWEEDFGQPLSGDHVLVSTSSCLGMALTMLAILDPGDEVIVFSPYFAVYRSQIELAGGGSGDTQQEQTGTLLKKIKDSGKLVVGTEAQYAPYEFKDLNANFAGCDMWLAQQIADSLGVKLEIVDMSFDGIIPAVKSGQVDLGIAAFTNTPERAKEIDFSNLYETSAQLLIVKTGNADVYSTKESLAGQKVGAQKGTIQSQLIQSALPDSELFELEKYPALALEVQNGNIAGLVVDQAVGESLVATSNGGLEVSNFAFTAEEASFGKSVVIAKGNEDLVAAVNQVIDKVTSDGSYQKAYDEAVKLAASLGL